MGCHGGEKPKVNYRKGLWSPEEDQRLRDYILKHGHGSWSAVPLKAGLQRKGKSCRLRWINYLRPGLKHGMFSGEEEQTVFNLHALLGNKWSQIAMHLPGRTDNEVKNYWNSYLKKKVAKAEASKSLNSGGEGPKTRLSSKEHKYLNSSLETSHPLESSTVDSGQSILYNTPRSSFPKLLFSDWLPMDNLNVQCSSITDTSVNFPWDCSNSQSEEVCRPGFLQGDEQVTGDQFIHGFGDSSIYGEFQSQFVPDGEFLSTGFFDLFSVGDMSVHFDANHDAIRSDFVHC